jgi:hypothetical protein
MRVSWYRGAGASMAAGKTDRRAEAVGVGSANHNPSHQAMTAVLPGQEIAGQFTLNRTSAMAPT